MATARVSIEYLLSRMEFSMDNPPWGCGEISEECVFTAYRENIFSVSPEFTDDLEYHVGRIAYFLKNLQSHPIEIDIGIPSLNFDFFAVNDGFHRLFAAIILRRKSIWAEWSGECEHLVNFLQRNNKEK